MIRVLFLINNLGDGGAQRVLVNLVNNMNKEVFDITVETMFDDGCYRSSLTPHVKYISRCCPCPRGISLLLKMLPSRLLYHYFIGSTTYDLLVAFLHGAPTKVLAGAPNSIKKAAWLHNGYPASGSFFRYWISKQSAIKAYATYDAIVGVSRSVTEAFREYTGIPNERFHTVYNANDLNSLHKLMLEPCELSFTSGRVKGEMTTICTAGRLVTQKGYDRLLYAVDRLLAQGYVLRVLIMGAGPERTKLIHLIEELGISEFVEMLGFRENPYPVMRHSDIYVLSSREEGLATVLTEALAVGLPIVATDVSGTREVLGEDCEYGLVVDNSEEGIYQGIKKMLETPDLMDLYRRRSDERAKEFDASRTVDQAEALFKEITSERSSWSV